MKHLAGIHSAMVATKRIRSHCLFSGAGNGMPVIFMHGNLSAATYFEELMLDMPAHYRCIAPDARGYGQTEDLPIDATRGVRDMVDDLKSLFEALDIKSAHLAGWSAGAGTIMQFALDYPGCVDSLLLISPVSPYGFGGTRDVKGAPISKDFAGSGAGTVSTEAVEQMRLGNTGLTSPVTPLQLLRSFFVKPGVQLEREDTLVKAMLQQRLGEHRYPGDFVPSQHWPHVAPGKWGPINALSPKYFNTSGFAGLHVKPPVLWIRGDADVVVSDNSLFDLAALRCAQQSADGAPLCATVCPQPMIGQMRAVLTRYQRNGGRFEEVLMEDAGHAPFLEKRTAFVRKYTEFLAQQSV